jgi:hypothetical protein
MCARLAKQWHVGIVVVDSMPAYDFAADLGRALPRGLVWLAEYVHGRDQPLDWSNQRNRTSLKKTSGEAKFEQHVKIDRYRHLLQTLKLWDQRRMVRPINLPDKEQPVMREGRRIRVQLGFELGKHLENIAQVSLPRKKRDPGSGIEIDTGTYEMTFRHLSIDPHFVHSLGYALAGLMYAAPKTQVFVASSKPSTEEGYRAQMMSKLPFFEQTRTKKGTCATCRFYESMEGNTQGYCTNKYQLASPGGQARIRVISSQPQCQFYRKGS